MSLGPHPTVLVVRLSYGWQALPVVDFQPDPDGAPCICPVGDGSYCDGACPWCNIMGNGEVTIHELRGLLE